MEKRDFLNHDFGNNLYKNFNFSFRELTKDIDTDEVFNAFSSGIGLLLSIIGFVYLMSLAIQKGSSLLIFCYFIYGKPELPCLPLLRYYIPPLP